MDIFGVGSLELLVLLLMGGVILGPRRVAELAREIGKFVRLVQNMTRNLTTELNREIALIEHSERQRSQQESHSKNKESSPLQEVNRKAGLPEAYQRFREDFPNEGGLEDDSSSEVSQGNNVQSGSRINGESE